MALVRGIRQVKFTLFIPVLFLTRRYCGICELYAAVVQAHVAGMPRAPPLRLLDIDAPEGRTWRARHHLNVPVLHFPALPGAAAGGGAAAAAAAEGRGGEDVLAGMPDGEVEGLLSAYARAAWRSAAPESSAANAE